MPGTGFGTYVVSDRDGGPSTRIPRSRITGEPCAVKVCATERGVESLTQSGGTRRNVLGSSGSPEGESRRGQQHAREAGATGRR